ncbi:hypothetical protein VP01_264g2 [Puccinia sorghi]|uniref:Uncharacterized protein n=1 Tax=Puccinia sorghi TaxID=27349 RepID=A0A0L6V607_9BASI|nr:hypothetical protein VP01_264g2 [Puccinia sorghi]
MNLFFGYDGEADAKVSILRQPLIDCQELASESVSVFSLVPRGYGVAVVLKCWGRGIARPINGLVGGRLGLKRNSPLVKLLVDPAAGKQSVMHPLQRTSSAHYHEKKKTREIKYQKINWVAALALAMNPDHPLFRINGLILPLHAFNSIYFSQTRGENKIKLPVRPLLLSGRGGGCRTASTGTLLEYDYLCAYPILQSPPQALMRSRNKFATASDHTVAWRTHIMISTTQPFHAEQDKIKPDEEILDFLTRAHHSDNSQSYRYKIKGTRRLSQQSCFSFSTSVLETPSYANLQSHTHKHRLKIRIIGASNILEISRKKLHIFIYHGCSCKRISPPPPTPGFIYLGISSDAGRTCSTCHHQSALYWDKYCEHCKYGRTDYTREVSEEKEKEYTTWKYNLSTCHAKPTLITNKLSPATPPEPSPQVYCFNITMKTSLREIFINVFAPFHHPSCNSWALVAWTLKIIQLKDMIKSSLGHHSLIENNKTVYYLSNEIN